MKKLVYKGEVDPKGKMTIYALASFKEQLRLLSGKKVEVIVRESKPFRSLQSNAYYWSCVIPTVRDILNSEGYSETLLSVHEMCKDRFLRQMVTNKDGVILLDEKGEPFFKGDVTTTDLTTDEFSHYINEIKNWMMNMFGAEIPEAGSQVSIEYEKI